jgi:hypothetical protein
MIPSRPPTLDTLTITPAPCSSIRGSTAKVSRMGAKKLTRMTASTSAGSRAVTARRLGIAALLTSTSMPPRASHACKPSGPLSARSATHIWESGEAFWQSANTSASRSRLRAISPTTAPCPANNRAREAPTPDEAPVISTRLPVTEYAMSSSLRRNGIPGC